MTERKASCACGQLRLTAVGEPVRNSVCHCTQCQRRTGGPFAQQARFPSESVTVEGDHHDYERIAESGNRAIFHFCPRCGTTVYYELEMIPGHYGVPVGCFADPEFPAPTVSVYGEHKHAWIKLPGDIEHM